MNPHRASGLTLLEVLLTVVLLSLATTMLVAPMAGDVRERNLREVASQWKAMDALARSFAKSNGPMVLSFDRERSVLVLTELHTNQISSEWPVSAETSLQVVGMSGTDRVLFDARGQSPDYRVTFRTEGKELSLTVSGVTGWIDRSNS